MALSRANQEKVRAGFAAWVRAEMERQLPLLLQTLNDEAERTSDTDMAARMAAVAVDLRRLVEVR
jgi:hypothetical protein